MKQISKLATALTFALGIGISSQANAEITLESNGIGDALIFPVFYNNGFFENYFAILNESNNWIQGHLRFRGAAWSGELLDLDVILSPYDVLEFRVADVDGDGFWELDQSLDPKNFLYTGSLENCGTIQKCAKMFTLLIPPAGGNIKPEAIAYHQNAGYIEFIGEGVLTGMTESLMNDLINPANAGQLAAKGQKSSSSKLSYNLGTHLWSWTSKGTKANAADVPNVLSGTAFITRPGVGYGLSYNAEALADFRTNANPHRIDNYPITAVILHDENAAGPAAGISPVGDYVYGFPFQPVGPYTVQDDRLDEASLRFSTTWGPTLADGDDYNTIKTLEGIAIPFPGMGQDYWDKALNHANGAKGPNFINSIAEVEEAIRLAGQQYTGLYWNNTPLDGTPTPPTALESWYYALFPTKHFYGQSNALAVPPTTFSTYLSTTVGKLLSWGKWYNGLITDTEENKFLCPPHDTPPTSTMSPTEIIPGTSESYLCYWPYEAYARSFNDIMYRDFLNNGTITPPPSPSNYSHGMFSIWPLAPYGSYNPVNPPSGSTSWPWLLYTFEIDASTSTAGSGFLHHWRSMQRSAKEKPQENDFTLKK